MFSEEEWNEAWKQPLLEARLEGLGPREAGKVRDMYRVGDLRVLVATDRISAFDRVLGAVPFRGQVLNQLSAWWFEATRDLVPNHVVSVPDPNVTIAREAEPLPIEVIVRGYITGSTKTSLWYLYEHGERAPYGVPLPEGLSKNDPLPEPIITPTTKAAPGEHDERLTAAEVTERGLVEPSLWARVQEVALALFARGQEVARRGGLVLVDTKYEFGLAEGELVLIDEVHTPDSSRYWDLAAYERGEIVHHDKEHLRLWYAARGFRGEGEPPPLAPELARELAQLYVGVFERLTGARFEPGAQPAGPRIQQSVERALAELGVRHG